MQRSDSSAFKVDITKNILIFKKRTNKTTSVYLALLVLISIPAFLLNLGLHPYLEDEAIRALVSLEMKLSGNYFHPTLGGEPYYAKPALYNWILLMFSSLTGGLNEWSTRLPTVIFVYLYSGYLYFVHRRLAFSKRDAFLISFMFLTCGRILFWDSFLGLIDIFYSLVSYAMIMEMYFSWKKKSPWRFYLLAYFLASVGFLLKGFPSVLFLYLTMAWLYLGIKNAPFSWRHIAHAGSLLIPLIIVGGYYYLYWQTENPESSLLGLMDQSTRRIVHYDVWAILEHLMVYPFENIYHFAPWSILIFLLFSFKNIKRIALIPWGKFVLGALIVNIAIYWISPEVFPRYILMLVPLSFSIFYFLYKDLSESSLWKKGYQTLWNILGIGSLVIMVLSFWDERIENIGGYLWKMIFLASLMMVGVILLIKEKREKILLVMFLLFTIRIGFNLFVIPIRTQEDQATLSKNDALRIATEYQHKELGMYQNSFRDYTTLFYLENHLQRIIRVSEASNILFINPGENLELPQGYEKKDSIYIRRIDQYIPIVINNN